MGSSEDADFLVTYIEMTLALLDDLSEDVELGCAKEKKMGHLDSGPFRRGEILSPE